MKGFSLKQSEDEFYTSHSAFALDNLCINNRYSGLSQRINRKMARIKGIIPHRYNSQFTVCSV
jgi:hypothetical protein